MTDREICQLRHQNGNCLPCGGFCTAVNDDICTALQMAYVHGKRDALELPKYVELIDDGPDYRCSGCSEKIKGEIVYMVSSVRYCPSCGKAVKWNEAN